jgi:hypothetical protein
MDMILYIINIIPKDYTTTIEICEEDLSESRMILQLLEDRFNLAIKESRKKDGIYGRYYCTNVKSIQRNY